MAAADVPAAQALTASFRWPHRREDWALMQGLGEGVVAEQDGYLAGTALCWPFGPAWATLGLIVVSEALQGRGVGRRMMDALLDRVAGRSLLLHSTPAGSKLYAALGFEPAGTVVQHQGAASQPGLEQLPGGTRLRPLCGTDLQRVVALDRAATGMDRAELLAALAARPGGIVLDREGEPVGFGLARRFGHGQVIGPLVAPDAAGARTIAAHLLGQRAGQFVRMDIPAESGLGPWLTSGGLQPVDTVTRMVRGGPLPPAGESRTFALASQAFG